MSNNKTLKNGDTIEFVKTKSYIVANNNLGQGSFGRTVLLKDPFINEFFVAKKYEPYYESDKEKFYNSFLQEIKIMYKLYHPNIVRIFNYYPYESVYTGYIIMEYIDGQNISDYMSFSIDWDNIEKVDNLFVQLIDAFAYLEERGIIHRDIRENNILVTQDGQIKVIDFGLGKSFLPVEKSEDSMVEIINRMGVDSLPEEYFDGKYDSQTDMFYLAELYNRLLRTSGNDSWFTHKSILKRMMEHSKSKRYQSFAEIKKLLDKKDFSSLEISNEDKKIYQDFSNAVFSCLSCFIDKKVFVNSIDEFKENLHNVKIKNCFEDTIHNPNDLVATIVKGKYKYYPQRIVYCTVLITFEEWFSKLETNSQILVLNNLIAKLSSKRVDLSNNDMPF